MSKEPEIISQNSSQSVLKMHEHQYGQTLLDLTFLNIDEGTIEFTTVVKDGTTYSYGNEEQYKRFSVDKDSLRLQEESVFVGRDVSFTYVPDDGDPFTTNAYITSFSFIYKSNGTEKEHTVIIDEIIDDIDRSGSFAENKYTIDIYGKEISKLSDETKTLILDNTEYVIKDLSTKMSWKGTMDFGINVNTDSNKPTGVVSAIAFNNATNSSGERVHSATHEQETGEDLNGITVDLGMNISLQDSYDPEIGQLTVYSANLWFDPNPNPNSFSNKPSNDGSTDSPLDYFDFISIVYHEVFHSMGIAYDPNNPDNSNRYSDNVLPADSEGNIYYSSDRANAILEGGILLDDELLDHWDLGPPVNGKVVTIMNSAGYYDFSWREPADIDWAVIQDIGWIKKTEGILSKTIDLNKNTLEAFSESSKGGTLNFSSGNNIIVADGQAKTLRGLDGDDTYFISNLLPKDSSIEIIDTSGINTIQIAANTKVIKTLWTQDAARLTFEDDRVITINGADKFTFNLGGNITNGEEGLDVTFSEFAFYFGINDINSISGSETGEVTDLYII